MKPEAFAVWSCHDPAAFLQKTEAWLLERVERYNLILGIAQQLRRGEAISEQPPWFAVFYDASGELACMAIRTPPWQALVTDVPVSARELVLDTLSEVWPDLNGLHGPAQASDALARAWAERHGVRAELDSPMRMFTLRQVIPPPGLEGGELQPFPPSWLELLVRWHEGFDGEMAMQNPRDPAETARKSLEEGNIYVWMVEGQPVSMALTIDAGVCARIGRVYTPPERRRRGYASACVAALSQAMLDQGYQFCSLYTDRRNPTSNKIYQELGYRPVEDVQKWIFSTEG